MKQSQTINESSSANFPPNLYLFSVLLCSLVISNNKSIAITYLHGLAQFKMATC